jgi:hypothetical protein
MYKSEIFVYYKHVKDKIWYATVMKVGLRIDQFKAIFVLKSPDPESTEAIDVGFVVERMGDMEDIFKNGRCLMLDDAVVKRFTKDREMNMSVSIEELHTA